MKSRLVFSLLAAFLAFAGMTPAHAKEKQSFEQWLEHYRAWDRLEKEYAHEPSADTPGAVLKRAQVYLNLNSPDKALELIEMTPAFPGQAEADRLWLGGQAHRGLGDLTKAVLWYTQAAKFMPDEEVLSRFKAEPDLEPIWHDVWLKMYWSWLANHTLSRDSQKEALDLIMTVGLKVWPNEFWNGVHALLSNKTLAANSTTDVAVPATVLVPQNDTMLIAQAMAAVSLEKFDEATAHIAKLSNEMVRQFWTSTLYFLNSGNTPTNVDAFLEGNYLKAHAFWSGNILAPYSKSRTDWFLGNPDSAAWTKFRNNILNMPAVEAEKAIDNELGSMLISEQTAALLRNFKLALSLANGNTQAAATTWNSTDKTSLPICLRLAGMLTFKEHLNKVLPETPSEAFTLYPVLAALSGAAGMDVHPDTEAPFWTAAPQDQLQVLSTVSYPLDRLLLLAYWQQRFADSPSVELAKRGAYLFDDTSFGIRSLIYLADDAVKAKQLQLGAFYLNRIDETTLPPELRMAWLDIKTRLELDAGSQGKALETYQDMVKTDEPIPVMTRLRMALLYQQRREYEAAQKELLAMWDARATMTTALQAETLFWLGEGEQAMRNPDKALDYYLKLAWQYPQENIWALTAMYRASLIYEKRGKYETAKRLLGTVVRNAARKEQRVAAQARIDAIDKKMGEEKSEGESTLIYPF
ncbi:tetratricopeptide repeat protein [Pseudodesulfovibrio thermohalotolerans]|uniref:tetratricopeptide repeat protein n=1 Tax=Pseudodesulfovibrio thermohalotolerans TaxID=2880651 RepID=UPI002443054E|nr:tetratricopeptide repeat protein [Pseudodesulfovibrio thermohalotolerans]WFS60910.1 tetratricopeptide repeat protein [Pseudodesulfovibrio thermohalotolerans]